MDLVGITILSVHAALTYVSMLQYQYVDYAAHWQRNCTMIVNSA